MIALKDDSCRPCRFALEIIDRIKFSVMVRILSACVVFKNMFFSMKFKFYISKKYYEMHSAYGNAHLNEKNYWAVLHLPIFVQIYAYSICKLNIIFHSKLSNEMPHLVLAHTMLSTNYKMHFTIFFSQLTNAYECLFENSMALRLRFN